MQKGQFDALNPVHRMQWGILAGLDSVLQMQKGQFDALNSVHRMRWAILSGLYSVLQMQKAGLAL